MAYAIQVVSPPAILDGCYLYIARRFQGNPVTATDALYSFSVGQGGYGYLPLELILGGFSLPGPLAALSLMNKQVVSEAEPIRMAVSSVLASVPGPTAPQVYSTVPATPNYIAAQQISTFGGGMLGYALGFTCRLFASTQTLQCPVSLIYGFGELDGGATNALATYSVAPGGGGVQLRNAVFAITNDLIENQQGFGSNAKNADSEDLEISGYFPNWIASGGTGIVFFAALAAYSASTAITFPGSIFSARQIFSPSYEIARNTVQATRTRSR